MSPEGASCLPCAAPLIAGPCLRPDPSPSSTRAWSIRRRIARVRAASSSSTGESRASGRKPPPSAAPADARIVDCGGDVVAPGLVDMRAFIGEPGAEHRETIASASAAAAAGGVTTLVARPDTNPPVDDPAVVDFILRRARDAAKRARAAVRGDDQGAGGARDRRDRPARGGRRGRLFRRAAFDRQCADDAPRDDLRARFRRADHALLRGPRARRRGRDRRGRCARAGSGLPGIPREAETIVLERDLRLVALTRARYHACFVSNPLSLAALAGAPAGGAPRHLRRLDQQSHAQRDRRRRLSHLPEAQPAAARRGRAARAGRGARRRADRRHRLRSRSAGRRDQAAAVRARPRRARSASRRCCRRACGWCRQAGSTLPRLLRAMSLRPAEILGLPHGPARRRRAGRSHPLRSRRALRARSRRRCIRAAATRLSTARGSRAGSS